MADEERRRAKRMASAERAASAWRDLAVLSSIGFLLAGAVAIGTLGGMWLDRHFHTGPWFTACGAILGSIAGFVQLFRLVKTLGTGKR